ncbi:MAG: ribosome maturation factor RimP [Rhodospirillales bacterium]|nr:ribosome maturation factor RimP [Rhodospirillales bacterium]MCB9995789.1 ribosome maturation factor RimP [Rhodospirillales bacterium]
MKQSGIERKITQLVQPVIEDKGFALVCVTMQGQELQIMAENPETRKLGVDDCAMLSREIGAILEVEDPIKGRYRLEVSSPGIDRPLIKIEDFVDFAGYEAKIEVNPAIEGQKRFRGYLTGVEDNEIVLDTDTGKAYLPYESVEKAKLVLTDELIRKTAGKK